MSTQQPGDDPTLEFPESPDGARQLATLPIVVKGLEPGQVKEQEASTLTASSSEFDCRISKVERLADSP